MQYLHPDVWSEISKYLSGEDLGILCSSNRGICRYILNRTTCLSYTRPVTRLFQSFPNLNTLRSNSEHGINLSLLPNTLTVLSLPEDNKVTENDLCNLPPSLTYLLLGWNNNITDAGISRLPPYLTFLNLEFGKKNNGCGNLSPSSFLNLFELGVEYSYNGWGNLSRSWFLNIFEIIFIYIYAKDNWWTCSHLLRRINQLS